jgi:hypothetical protein
MLTTGFKLYFGMCLGALVAAITFGYTTGGNNTGPLTLGWKGSVGNHAGYTILIGLAGICGVLAFMLLSFRDADPRAAAELLGVGVDVVPAQRPTQPSYWPLVTMFGVATAVLGLVLSSAIFVVGLGLLAVVAFEWAMQAWADRATGDPVANRELRDRVMAPIEVPILAAIAIAAVPIGASRVFLSTSRIGAVWVAGIVATVVLGVAVLLALRPRVSKNVLAGVVLFGGLAFIAAGITAAAVGERTFHPHEAEHGTTEQPAEGK